MFCSTVIPTIGRPTLERAVCSVLDQSFTAGEFEVIVVNDSGSPLAPAGWKRSPHARVLDTNRRERCVARNAGAAIAKGKYLHFLDDDDWMMPRALEAFWNLGQRSDAAWLYGASQLVDRLDRPLIQLHHNLSGNCLTQVMAGEWIPLQAALIDARVFSAVGGFDPLIPGTEDIHLLRQIALVGELAETQDVVATIRMGMEGSSTDYMRAAQLRRQAREPILSQPAAFTRMAASAVSAKWKGRFVRSYLTSVAWNLTYGRLLVALSRTAFALRALIHARRDVFSSDCWRNILRSYDSETFLRGFREAGLPVSRRDV